MFNRLNCNIARNCRARSVFLHRTEEIFYNRAEINVYYLRELVFLVDVIFLNFFLTEGIKNSSHLRVMSSAMTHSQAGHEV